MPKKNKSKKEIVSDIQLVQDSERRRSLIRDIVFPYLVSLDESTAYAKIFLQSVAGIIEGVWEERRKKTTIGSMAEELDKKMETLFRVTDEKEKEEYARYVKIVDLLKDISVQDFSYAAELPRYIDGYLTKDSGKKPLKEVPIDQILG